MPRYFLNVEDSVGYIEDAEGVELPNLDVARAKAVAGVRSIVAEGVMNGRADLRGRIDVADEAGKVLLAIRFAEIVEIVAGERG